MGQSHIERERERAMTRGRTDYTLLLLLSVTTSSGAILRDRHYLAELNPEAGSNWGDWGRLEFCPEGSWAAGFQLKVEKDCGAMCDDTALNGVRLFCTGVDGSDRGGVSSLWVGLGPGPTHTPVALLVHSSVEFSLDLKMKPLQVLVMITTGTGMRLRGTIKRSLHWRDCTG